MGIKAKHKWLVRFYKSSTRPFDANNERKLERDGSTINHRTLNIARRSAVRNSEFGFRIALAGHIDEEKRRVVEIRVFDEGYSGE